jgi:NADH-quinone oxidoreductase subunit N
MPTEFWYAMAPDLALLGAVVVGMLLETSRLPARWGQAAFVAALVAALALLFGQISQGYAAVVIDGELAVDRLAVVGKAVLALCGLGVAAWFPGAVRPHKFWLLAASSILGGMLMLDSASFATLFIGLELLSMPAFALIVQGQGQTAAAEGAFKYLVLSSVASALFLFGASVGYGLTGSLALDAFGGLFQGGGLQAQAALLLVLSGLFLKAAVFPFHAWAPDAYAAARLPVTALMASVVKAAVVLAIVRIVGPFPLDQAAVAVITGLAIVSIVFGNLAALGQPRFKRLIAYSSVAHAGYMIFALLDVTGSRASDLLWYTAFYGLGTVLACASFAVLCPGEDDRLERLDGQFAQRPVAAIVLALAMLSLAGVPPLPGFFAKVFVFKSVIASGYTPWATLAFIGSFLGLAYYVGIALRLFRVAAAPGTAPSGTAPTPDRARRRDETVV